MTGVGKGVDVGGGVGVLVGVEVGSGVSVGEGVIVGVAEAVAVTGGLGVITMVGVGWAGAIDWQATRRIVNKIGRRRIGRIIAFILTTLVKLEKRVSRACLRVLDILVVCWR